MSQTAKFSWRDLLAKRKPVDRYDLAAYRDDIRGFYLDLSELPGAIVETEEALIQAIPQALEQDAYDEKYQRFHARFNALDDGHASERVVKRLLETK